MIKVWQIISQFLHRNSKFKKAPKEIKQERKLESIHPSSIPSHSCTQGHGEEAGIMGENEKMCCCLKETEVAKYFVNKYAEAYFVFIYIYDFNIAKNNNNNNNREIMLLISILASVDQTSECVHNLLRAHW